MVRQTQCLGHTNERSAQCVARFVHFQAVSQVLKGVKHPANCGSLQSLKLKYSFKNFLFLQKQNDIPLKKLLDTLNLFSQFEFPKNGEVLPNLNWPRDVNKGLKLFSLSFSPKV